MDVLKKALMVLGVLWILGFISMMVMGYGAYSLLSSGKVEETVAHIEKQQTKIIKEAQMAEYYRDDSAREPMQDYSSE